MDIGEVRNRLVRLEDTIVNCLFDRMQYSHNSLIYQPREIEIPDFDGSFFEYLLRGTEELHSSAGRYKDPREHPFLITPSNPIIPRKEFDDVIKSTVNLNPEILKVYLGYLPRLCSPGDDNMYGSAAIADINCLQNLSMRIHLGELVAKIKFEEDPEVYTRLILDHDEDGIKEKLRNMDVERRNLRSVGNKGKRYSMDPELIKSFYKNQIMPLTIKVEVIYFGNMEEELLAKKV